MRLDELMRTWAADRGPGEEQARRLKSRVLAAVHRESAGLACAGAGAPVRSAARLAWGAAGALAVVMLALVMGRAVLRTSAGGGTPAASAATAVLFQELSRLFAGSLRWAAQSDGEITLGTGEPLRSPPDAAMLAVRIDVMCRDASGADWRRVWESDVLTLAGQMVDVMLSPSRADRLALWVLPVDGSVRTYAVDARLDLNTAVRLSSETTGVLREGVSTEVWGLRVDGREYRIYQTVTRLKKDGASC